MVRIHKGHVLGVAAFLSAPVAVFASKALAVLFVAAAVFALGVERWRAGAFPRLAPGWVLMMGAVVLWGAATWVWANDAGLAMGQTLRQAGTFLAGLLLVALAASQSDEERAFFDAGLVAGVALAVAILAVEIATDAVISRTVRPLFTVKAAELYIADFTANLYRTGAAVTALMLWPALAALWARGRRIGAIVLFGAAAATLANSHSGSSILALMAGTGALFAALALGRRAAVVFGVVCVLAVALAPAGANMVSDIRAFERRNPDLPSSLYPRLFIWKSAAGFIAETPALGRGLNMSKTLSSRKDMVEYSYSYKDKTVRKLEPIPLHPHNVALQVWLELGAVGAALLAMVLVGLVRAARGAFDYAALFSALAVGFVSFSVWASWWQGCLWMLAAFSAGAWRKAE